MSELSFGKAILRRGIRAGFSEDNAILSEEVLKLKGGIFASSIRL
jgi:hypothetical protein